MNPRTLLALVVLAVAGCAAEDTNTEPIVTITNNWADAADATHTFQFNSADDGERAGAFVGSEQFNGVNTYSLTGSWGNGTVVFTVARPDPIRYTARANDDNQTRFVFESSAGQLVLSHGS
jgi:hypothetical protein